MEYFIVVSFAFTAIIFYCLGNWAGRHEQTLINNYRSDIEKIEDELRHKNISE